MQQCLDWSCCNVKTLQSSIHVGFNTWNMPHGARDPIRTKFKFCSWNSHDPLIKRHFLELVKTREGRKQKAETIKRERCMIQSWKPSRSLWMYIHQSAWRVGRIFCGHLFLWFFLNRKIKYPQIIVTIGRVSSVVNYDKTYGIFLRGFANLCAVSNSVNYDRALLWWSTGTLVELTDASLRRHWPRATGRCRFDFISIPVPLLYFFVSFSA